MTLKQFKIPMTLSLVFLSLLTLFSKHIDTTMVRKFFHHALVCDIACKIKDINAKFLLVDFPIYPTPPGRLSFSKRIIQDLIP